MLKYTGRTDRVHDSEGLSCCTWRITYISSGHECRNFNNDISSSRIYRGGVTTIIVQTM